ncbi:MAG: nuclear transport factor 2 family protein [Candidatus Eiseniibacteriota bacterium]
MTARASRGIFAAALAALLLLPACNQHSTPSAVETFSAKAAVDSLWSGYAHASDEKDAEGFAKLFTEDAAVDYSGAPTVRGRDAIKLFLTSHYEKIDPTGLRIEPDEIRVSGETAIQSGAYEERFIEGNKEMTEYGRFVLVAEGDGKGAWKIRRLMAITDSTAAD